MKREGYTLERNRDGLRQIDFGNKKLHEGHIELLYPEILNPDVHMSTLIDNVAPGRPCAHRPMKEIMKKIRGSYQEGHSIFGAMQGSVVTCGDVVHPTGEVWNVDY